MGVKELKILEKKRIVESVIPRRIEPRGVSEKVLSEIAKG